LRRFDNQLQHLAALNAFEVSRVCDDARELLELIELIQLRVSFFFTAINSAHRLWFSVSHHLLSNCD
jgi:hypothetical protein